MSAGVVGATMRAEASRLVSLRDTRVAVTVALLAVVAGAIAGGLVDGPIGEVDGYLRTRGAMPVLEFALPLWCGAIAAMRAGERRHGIETLVDIVNPSRVRSVLSGAAVTFMAGALLGALIGGVSAIAATAGVADAGAIGAHALRCAVVYAVLGVAAYGLGSLLRNEVAAWALVLGWCLIGERLLASIPGLGSVVGAGLPVRSADYFLYGDDRGAAYPWGAEWAIAVPALWAVAAVGGALYRRTVLTMRKEAPV